MGIIQQKISKHIEEEYEKGKKYSEEKYSKKII